jgi:predicted kinase/RimJ/RimL family protein N-acetyltransferase
METAVTLREVRDEDLGVLYENQADPQSGAMAGVEPRDRDTFLAHQEQVAADPEALQRVIVLPDGEVAGDIAAWRTEDGVREIGYRIGSRHWGRGIATAALTVFLAEFGERPLYAHVLKTNAASIRVLEKCGFAQLSPGEAPDDDPEAYEFVLRRTDAKDRATVYLIVGLPGAGKTTRAKELETSESALRLTPDEWQIALFGDQNPPDKRDLVEGRLVELGMRAAELGINVVLDFGFWGKDERSALRWIAGTVGARSQVVYLPIEHEEQRRRVTGRFDTTPDQTFHMSDVELEQWRAQFQAPDDEELRGSQIPPAPPEHATWSQWASERWPSLPDQYRSR